MKPMMLHDDVNLLRRHVTFLTSGIFNEY